MQLRLETTAPARQHAGDSSSERLAVCDYFKSDAGSVLSP